MSDFNFTYCSSPGELQGGEGRLQSCDRLLIHSPPQLTSSLVDNHLPSNIFIPYPHHQRVNFNFVENFVTKKVHFSFHFQFLRHFCIKIIPYFGHFQANQISAFQSNYFSYSYQSKFIEFIVTHSEQDKTQFVDLGIQQHWHPISFKQLSIWIEEHVEL